MNLHQQVSPLRSLGPCDGVSDVAGVGGRKMVEDEFYGGIFLDALHTGVAL